VIKHSRLMAPNAQKSAAVRLGSGLGQPALTVAPDHPGRLSGPEGQPMIPIDKDYERLGEPAGRAFWRFRIVSAEPMMARGLRPWPLRCS
jgi:hypothetical protein